MLSLKTCRISVALKCLILVFFSFLTLYAAPSKAEDISTQYHVVFASRQDLNEAIDLAKQLENKYPVEVYPTPNDWYAITIGHYDRQEAKRVRAQAIDAGDIKDEAWIGTGKKSGEKWGERVYPASTEEAAPVEETSNSIENSSEGAEKTPQRIEAERLVKLGQRFAEKGEIDNAIQEYQRASVADPTWDLPYIGLMRGYEIKQDLEQELNAAKRLLEIDPDNSTAKYVIRAIEEHQKREQELAAEREILKGNTTQETEESGNYNPDEGESYSKDETTESSNSNAFLLLLMLGGTGLVGFVGYTIWKSKKSNHPETPINIVAASESHQVTQIPSTTYLGFIGSGLVLLSFFAPVSWDASIWQYGFTGWKHFAAQVVSISILCLGGLSILGTKQKNNFLLWLSVVLIIISVIYGLISYNISIEKVFNLQIGFYLLVLGTVLLAIQAKTTK
jgi:tetratricopeptide (TPR) repeat protein